MTPEEIEARYAMVSQDYLDKAMEEVMPKLEVCLSNHAAFDAYMEEREAA